MTNFQCRRANVVDLPVHTSFPGSLLGRGNRIWTKRIPRREKKIIHCIGTKRLLIEFFFTLLERSTITLLQLNTKKFGIVCGFQLDSLHKAQGAVLLVTNTDFDDSDLLDLWREMTQYHLPTSPNSFHEFEESLVETNMSYFVLEPNENDILLGRGGKNNQHVGNEQLRELARIQCENYRQSSKKGKSYISRQLVKQVRSMSPPGRFLKKDSITGYWEDVGDDVAREKASQALRDAVSTLFMPPCSSNSEQMKVCSDSNDEQPGHSRARSAPSVSTAMAISADSRFNTVPRSTSLPGGYSSPSLPQQRRLRSASAPVSRETVSLITPETSTSSILEPYDYSLPESVISSSSARAHPPQHTRSESPSYIPRATLPPSTAPLSPVQSAHSSQSRRTSSFDASSAFLGDVGSDMNEFDLFNGDLLNSPTL